MNTVYIVMAGNTSDYGNSESYVQSVHRTEKSAYLARQAKELEQLQEQLLRLQEKPGHNVDLSTRWWVKEYSLND